MERHGLARHQLMGTAMDELYNWAPVRQLVADVNHFETAYLSADPSNGMVIQIYSEGHGQAWHFDEALFSTIINLSEPEGGGIFECVPNIRTDDDEAYDAIHKVLQGDEIQVQKYRVKEGSFVLQLGRYTLHRVSPIEGEKPRISMILSYDKVPGTHMTSATRKKLFGPTAPN